MIDLLQAALPTGWTGMRNQTVPVSRILIVAAFCFVCINSFAKPCVGKFVNPITDICWACMLPIRIGPMPNLSSQIDTKNPSNPVCLCPKEGSPVPVPGIVVSFWEPVRLVDVTRTPYCMVGLGGISMGGGGIKGHGGVEYSDDGGKSSFYNVHYYVYPLIYWLELLTDFGCMEMASFDVAYMTELDPTWNNDELGAILSPEAALFANPIMQATCAADCIAATAGFPLDSLSWCAGCHGSIYPFSGTVGSHAGGVSAALLLVERMLAKHHRTGLAWETSGKRALCKKRICPVIKKTQYKTQMTYPKPHTNSKTACNPLGRTSFFWGSGREYPYKGEDFGFLIWRKRTCCML